MDTREPCPWRIVDDCGGAFAVGAIGGSIFHGIKGFRQAPSGVFNRWTSATEMIRRKAPRTGAAFSAWAVAFSAIDCSLVYVRKKEDPWNSIMSGALTGGLISIRQGRAMMISSSLFGGLMLAAIEGFGILFNRYSTRMMMMAEPPSSGGGADFSSGYSKGNSTNISDTTDNRAGGSSVFTSSYS
ncbi:hypothetical protein GJ496_008760 [Pomphorhynchus laevis]|nr:hypothetical protein GJ496_008760 [Pomphorhynchus laevis]